MREKSIQLSNYSFFGDEYLNNFEKVGYFA